MNERIIYKIGLSSTYLGGKTNTNKMKVSQTSLFAATLFYFPDDSLTVAYCSNGQAYNLNDISIGVLSICFDREYRIPQFNTISLKTEDLDKYLGDYTSKQIPLKITITKDDVTLMVQATGQSAFPLEATEKDNFKFEKAKVKIEFNTETNTLTLIQGGVNYLFTKNK